MNELRRWIEQMNGEKNTRTNINTHTYNHRSCQASHIRHSQHWRTVHIFTQRGQTIFFFLLSWMKNTDGQKNTVIFFISSFVIKDSGQTNCSSDQRRDGMEITEAGGRVGIKKKKEQIKETIYIINLQYYLLEAAGKGTFMSWVFTKETSSLLEHLTQPII